MIHKDMQTQVTFPNIPKEFLPYGQMAIALRYKIVEVLPMRAERIPSQPPPEKNIAIGPILYIRLIALYFC